MWFRVDDGFVEDSKTIAAARALGGQRPMARVVAVWLEAGLYCSRQLTDGLLPRPVLERLLTDNQPLEVAAALVVANLWLPAGEDFQFYKWLKYQPSAAEVKARRAADLARKRTMKNGGKGRGQSARTLAGFFVDSEWNPIGIPAEFQPEGARTDGRSLCVPTLIPSEVPSAGEQADARRPPLAMGLTQIPERERVPRRVHEVRSHLLAAVHLSIKSGPPFVDDAGTPVEGELDAQLSIHAGRHLGIDLNDPRERDALAGVLRAGIARHARQAQATRAREAFGRRDIAAFVKTEAGRRWQRATQARRHA